MFYEDLKIIINRYREFEKFVPAINHAVVIEDGFDEEDLKKIPKELEIFKLPHDTVFFEKRINSVLLFYTPDGLGAITIYKNTTKPFNIRVIVGLVTLNEENVLDFDMQVTFSGFVNKRKRNFLTRFNPKQLLKGNDRTIKKNFKNAVYGAMIENCNPTLTSIVEN
jgi:hypothetical protein